MKKDGRGGPRPGSGRKAYNPEDKRVQMVVTIDKVTRERLKDAAAQKNMRVGRLLDKMAEDLDK